MSQRNLRRLTGKKNATDLAHAIHGLKELSTGIRAALPETVTELAAAREAVLTYQDGIIELQYQLERQRAVFLRMLSAQLIDGTMEDLLAIEAEYGAEFDAMRFLCRMATLGSSEEP